MKKCGVVMDPIAMIHYQKDSTLAMLWEAQARGYDLYYFEQQNLFIQDGIAYGQAKQLSVHQRPDHWFSFGDTIVLPLSELNTILMRKDPPFNQEYIYTTYILEHAARNGVLVINRPQSLRDANEKIFTTFFPECAPSTIVTRSSKLLRDFWQSQGDIVCKPLDVMGGSSVFRLRANDVNATVVFETLTHQETTFVMAQTFIPAIEAGDKRIILVNGEPIPHALARVPQGSDWRGNLAVGAKGIVQPLSDRDRWICEHIGPVLREKGLYFVGIDVIGDYLTEINVTSPTGIREIDLHAGSNIAGVLFDWIESRKA